MTQKFRYMFNHFYAVCAENYRIHLNTATAITPFNVTDLVPIESSYVTSY